MDLCLAVEMIDFLAFRTSPKSSRSQFGTGSRGRLGTSSPKARTFGENQSFILKILLENEYFRCMKTILSYFPYVKNSTKMHH
jgi:hypothetical protein